MTPADLASNSLYRFMLCATFPLAVMAYSTQTMVNAVTQQNTLNHILQSI